MTEVLTKCESVSEVQVSSSCPENFISDSSESDRIISVVSSDTGTSSELGTGRIADLQVAYITDEAFSFVRPEKNQ